MKKTTLLALGMGLALTFGTASKGEAFCLFGCGGDSKGDEDVVQTIAKDNDDSAVASGKDNMATSDTSNSVVIGGDVSSRQSNNIGAIGINKGDISQSNAANITGQQNLQNNNMSDFSVRGNR